MTSRAYRPGARQIQAVLLALVVSWLAPCLPVRAEASPGPAAGFWTWLAGTQRDRPPGTLDEAVAVMAGLPAEPGRATLAIGATDVGHWQITNRSGEVFTAADGKELASAWPALAPDIAGDPGRLTLCLAEEVLFRAGARLDALPAAARLIVALEGQPRRIWRPDAGERLPVQVEVRPGLRMALGEFGVYREMIRQLDRPLVRADVRLLSLEPGGPTGVPRAPLVEPATRQAIADPIDPSHLASALKTLAGRTVLISGRIDNDRLVFQPAKGTEVGLAIEGLLASAAAADTNLVVLASSSPRQPGTRNWLLQRVEVWRLSSAIEQQTVGGFLAALVGDDDGLVIRARDTTPTRIAIDAWPASAGNSGLGGAISDSVTGTVAEIVTETAGRIAVQGFRTSLVASGRRSELARRLLSGIPSLLQLGYVATLVLGLMSWPASSGWWRRIWPPELPAEYGASTSYWLARMARGVLFALVFLPLAAIPGLVATVLMLIGARKA